MKDIALQSNAFRQQIALVIFQINELRHEKHRLFVSLFARHTPERYREIEVEFLSVCAQRGALEGEIDRMFAHRYEIISKDVADACEEFSRLLEDGIGIRTAEPEVSFVDQRRNQLKKVGLVALGVSLAASIISTLFK